MADIRITPAASVMAFTSSLAFKETFTQSASGSIVLYGSGSTGRTNLFAVDGNNGRLFSVDDDLSGTLFSVNTIAGLPVIEAFANNTVNIGKYGAYSFQALGNGNAGIGSGSVMFVSASGNVGIRNTSPFYSLDLTGQTTRTVRIYSPSTDTRLYFQNTTSGAPTTDAGLMTGLVVDDGYLYNYQAGNLIFGTNSAERMRITPAGNVGIGTSDIGYVTSGRTILTLAGASTALMEYKVGGSSKSYIYSNSTDFELYDSNRISLTVNGAYRMIVNSSGQVGIGTTSPTGLLNIYGSNAIFNITNTNASAYGEFWFSEGGSIKAELFVVGSSLSSYAGANSLIIYQNSNAPIAFYTNGGNERMRITGAGLVGIGITSPSYKLDVYGTTRLDPQSGEYGLVVGRASGMANVRAGTDDGGYLLMDSSNMGGVAGLNWYSSENVVLAWGGGNVGVATSSPSYKLDVAGTFRATSTIYANSVLTMSSTSAPSAAADSISLYAQDVNASSELKVIDEAGNITTLSPHNFSLIPEGPSEDLAWSYYSENNGKKINVDMLKLARTLEKLTGEKLVYIE